jgi:hypothetical protein
VRSRLISGNACYQLAQNILSIIVKIKICLYNVSVGLYEIVILSLDVRKEHMKCLRIGCKCENMELSKGEGENYVMARLIIFTPYYDD